MLDDAAPIRPFHLRIIATVTLAAVADGYDTFAMAAIAPLLRRDWHISPSLLGAIFSAALIGGMLGALLSPWAARTFGRRMALIGSLLWFAAGSAASPSAYDGVSMLAARLGTGVGLGMTMPLLWAIMADSLPSRVRGRGLSSIAAGLPVGGLLAGFASAALLPRHGWHPTFWLGAVLPLLAIPLAWVSIADPLAKPAGPQASAEPSLAARAPAVPAFAMLLIAAACTSTLTYGLANWLPTLVSGLGLSISASAASEGLLTAGAFGSVLIFGYVVDKIGAIIATAVSFTATALVLFSFGFLGGKELLLDVGIFASGFFVGGAQFGVTYLYSTHFSGAFRLTAISFGVIASRAGAIVGPIAPGFLLKAHWTAASLFDLGGVLAMLLTAAILIAKTLSNGVRTP